MSKTIPLKGFLRGVDSIVQEAPAYRLGHDGSDGLCDCIGLIIGGIRRAGGTWSGIHGSNYAARQETLGLSPIRSAQELVTGQVVFKASSPGQAAYSLPARYAGDPDQRDYYHIGVVTAVSPLEITHCSGPGILKDSKLGKWSYHGWLKKISQEGDEPMQESTLVTATSGSTVNLRSSPHGPLLARVPVGTAVTVLSRQDGWAQVSYQDQTGWMMERYLSAGAAPQESISITLPAGTAQALLSALAGQLGRG